MVVVCVCVFTSVVIVNGVSVIVTDVTGFVTYAYIVGFAIGVLAVVMISIFLM